MIPIRPQGASREAWQTFAEHSYLFRGTPTGAWLDHELYELFEVRTKLDGGTAGEIYDQIVAKLRSAEFLPRALFDGFGIEVLATTDAATDSLDDHLGIRKSGWDGNVIPTFRPHPLFRIASPRWRDDIAALGKAVRFDATTYSSFVRALEERRDFFRSAGATVTDHDVLDPYTERLSGADAEKLFGEAYGNDPRLTLVVFTLDESTYARGLAPTRAFCSIPARHDLSRRVDANWLGGLVARHIVDLSDAREMGRALACDLPREAYKLDRVIERAPDARDSGAGKESAA